MKSILVTGSRGFIGGALKNRLISNGINVLELAPETDLAESESLNSFECQDIDYVFHLAGRTFVPESWEDPHTFYRTNLTGTINVLDFCRRKSIPMTFVSAYLYGQPVKLPISEDHPIKPDNPYAHSKYLAEQVCEFYAKEFGVRMVIIRPFNVFGPGQDEKFLIPFIIKQAQSNEVIKVKDLEPRRDYIYLDDLIDALVLTMEIQKNFSIFNIGSGSSVSVREIIDIVQNVLGTDKEIVCEEITRKNEIIDVVADISHAQKELGWFPKTSFYNGIVRLTSQSQYIPINKGNYSMETPEREGLFEEYRAEGWEEEYRDYRRHWVEYAKNKIVSEYPLLIDAELATACNLKCPMCYTITDEFKNKVNVSLMEFGLFKKIIDEIRGKVPSLRLSLRGEPTLHKKFAECIQYAKENGIKEVSFLTNGSKLTKEFFIEIMEAGVDWITISVDGIGEVYEGIRKPLKFKETLQKIIDIKRIKDERGVRKPVIKIQSVWPAIKSNPETYYNTFEANVDLIAYNPLIDYLGNDKDIIYEDGFSCPQHYQRLVIGADGLAMMCSNDEDGTVIVGDVNKESIFDIWHGEKLNNIRTIHKKQNGFMEIPVCRRCYLPRATEDGERATVNGREFIIQNYINRGQEVGK